jgi:hypothetical protein
MQEITHDLCRLADETARLSSRVDRLMLAVERMVVELGCPLVETDLEAAAKPLRRRNFKDALEAVLDTRERIMRIEHLMATLAPADLATAEKSAPDENEGDPPGNP